ncbi:MAG TPA: hypothetical protein ENI05_00410 [Porticoccus sp.]|nr:hypothetical protein [Porticoccus sp.]
MTRLNSILKPPILSTLALHSAQADIITEPKALHQLLNGNSLAGSYNEMLFKQVLQTDGVVLVAIKGQPGILKARWFINDKAEYCEQWPDHLSCFQIGQGEGNLLIVKSKDDAKIVSRLFEGAIPLDFD